MEYIRVGIGRNTCALKNPFQLPLKLEKTSRKSKMNIRFYVTILPRIVGYIFTLQVETFCVFLDTHAHPQYYRLAIAIHELFSGTFSGFI